MPTAKWTTFEFYLQPEKTLRHSNDKNWIDSGAWQQHFNGFHLMPRHEQQEIKEAVIQSAAGLLLMDYIRNSPSSPIHRVNSIFVRCEYQKDAGNLSHIHSIMEVKKCLTDQERLFIDDILTSTAWTS